MEKSKADMSKWEDVTMGDLLNPEGKERGGCEQCGACPGDMSAANVDKLRRWSEENGFKYLSLCLKCKAPVYVKKQPPPPPYYSAAVPFPAGIPVRNVAPRRRKVRFRRRVRVALQVNATIVETTGYVPLWGNTGAIARFLARITGAPGVAYLEKGEWVAVVGRDSGPVVTFEIYDIHQEEQRVGKVAGPWYFERWEDITSTVKYKYKPEGEGETMGDMLENFEKRHGLRKGPKNEG